MSAFRFSLSFANSITAAIFLILSCKPVDNSNLQIANGADTSSVAEFAVLESSKGKCSGSVVSIEPVTTVLTAAHCLADFGDSSGESAGGLSLNGSPSQKAYYAPEFKKYTETAGQYDLAVVVFAKGLGKGNAKLAVNPPQINDDVSLFGFGKFKLAKDNDGIFAVLGITNNKDDKAPKVTTTEEDSGAPLYNGKGEQIAVAASGAITGKNEDSSLFTSLFSSYSKKLLERAAEGQAIIPGYLKPNGENGTHTPTATPTGSGTPPNGSPTPTSTATPNGSVTPTPDPSDPRPLSGGVPMGSCSCENDTVNNNCGLLQNKEYVAYLGINAGELCDLNFCTKFFTNVLKTFCAYTK